MDGLLHGAEEAALTGAILGVADLLGFQVIAEGVEQEALLVAEQGRRAAASRRRRSQVV